MAVALGAERDQWWPVVVGVYHANKINKGQASWLALLF
jgi:hypothetical protein